MTAATCIHVIDDDVSWRKSLDRLMSAAGYRVALYESAESFLETADLEVPGCILLDLRMPGLTGLQLQRHLASKKSTLPIIFLSGHGDVPSSVSAIKAGAADFLTKPVETALLLRVVGQAIAAHLENRARREHLEVLQSRVSTLTPTERKVFDLVVLGRLNKLIADELGTAERTIKWHRHNLMQKLQVQSVAELVSMAEHLDLVSGRDSQNSNPHN
jgi:FixJ family two-component response regulator